MATVTGLTAARMQEIIDKTIVDADVVGDNLILTLDDASTINAGNVRGPEGPEGPMGASGGSADFPAGAVNGQLLAADSTATEGVAWVNADIADIYANRPPAVSGLNGVRFFATDKLMEWECVAAAWVLINAYAPIVTGLPSSPVDGQECKFQADATNGINWHLRYNAASGSAYKWEFAGGAELYSFIQTEEATSSTTYTNLATIGPTVTSPLAGEYMCEIFAHVYRPSTSGNAAGIMFNSSAAGPIGGVEDALAQIFASNASHTLTRKFKKTLTAGQAMVLKYVTGTAAATNFYNRSASIRPIRVG